MTSRNLAVALRLAAAGLSVFPTDDRKRPLGKWTQESTDNPKIICRWPKFSLVAIDLRKCGLLVIDADRHGGPDGVAAWEELVREHGADLSRQPMARTPSNGRHIYFSQPEGKPLGNAAVIAANGGRPAFLNLLMTVAPNKDGNYVNKESLGRWLSRNKGHPVGRAMIADGGIADENIAHKSILECR